MMPHTELQIAYQLLLLTKQWGWYISLTVEQHRIPTTTQRQMRHKFDKFLWGWHAQSAISQGLASKRGTRVIGNWASAWKHGRGHPEWFAVFDRHADGLHHIHVLLTPTRAEPTLNPTIGESVWRRIAGGSPKIEVSRSQWQVTSYLARKVKWCGSDAFELSEELDLGSTPPNCGVRVPAIIRELVQANGIRYAEQLKLLPYLHCAYRDREHELQAYMAMRLENN